MLDPKIVGTIKVVENEKEQADSFTTLWCVTGTVLIQRHSDDSGDPEMIQKPYVFNVVARRPRDAVKAYFGQVADLNMLHDVVAQATIISVKWCARVDAH